MYIDEILYRNFYSIGNSLQGFYKPPKIILTKTGFLPPETKGYYQLKLYILFVPGVKNPVFFQ